MSQALIDAIKAAAGNTRKDDVSYYSCTVLAQDDGSKYNEDELTIRVQTITSRSVTSTEYDEDIYGGSTNPNNMLGPNIMENVQLMASVDDGCMVVPTIGSVVVVMTSTYQNPLVVQYSNVDIIYVDSDESYNINVGKSSDETKSSLVMQSALMSLGTQTLDGAAAGSITTAKDYVNIDVIDNSNILVNDKITLTSKNGNIITADAGIAIKTSGNAEINAETLITLKNSVTSLKGLFSDLVTALNTGANSGGPVVFAGDPGFAALLVKINGLLGS